MDMWNCSYCGCVSVCSNVKGENRHPTLLSGIQWCKVHKSLFTSPLDISAKVPNKILSSSSSLLLFLPLILACTEQFIHIICQINPSNLFWMIEWFFTLVIKSEKYIFSFMGNFVTCVWMIDFQIQMAKDKMLQSHLKALKQ